MAHEAVELDEGAGIEQLLEPFVGKQLALRALALDRLLGRRVERGLAQAVELLELSLGGLRAIVRRRHEPEPN